MIGKRLNPTRFCPLILVAVACWAFPLKSDVVSLRLPDGSLVSIRVGSDGMPDPVRTSLFSVDTVGMLMNVKGKYVIWMVGGDLEVPHPVDITIEPLLLPGRSVKAEALPSHRFSFHGWRSDQDKDAWRFLDEPGISYFPVRVTGRDLSNGQTVSVVAAGAFTPAVKTIIRNSIDWRTSYSCTLPDGSKLDVPIRDGKVIHEDLPAYKVENLSIRKDPGLGWGWALKIDIKDSQATSLVLSSPLDREWTVTLPLAGAGERVCDFAPMKAGGPMWSWLHGEGDAFVPIQVEVRGTAGPLGHSLEWAIGGDAARQALKP
ncbi:MAG TPA: hypothetical protein VJ600_00760 [Holophagaceae bacterium]|nr:hypothetical protein [Holophagaceae bacterium]